MTSERLSRSAVYETIEVTEAANSRLSHEPGAEATLLVPGHGVFKTFPVVRQTNRHSLQHIVAEIKLYRLDAFLEDLAVLLEELIVLYSFPLQRFSFNNVELYLLPDAINIAHLVRLIEYGLAVFHNGILRVKRNEFRSRIIVVITALLDKALN